MPRCPPAAYDEGFLCLDPGTGDHCDPVNFPGSISRTLRRSSKEQAAAKREIDSRLEVLLMHLLKRQVQVLY
jgi:hypothetical protein